MNALMDWYMENPARDNILLGVIIAAVILAVLGLYLCSDNRTTNIGIILIFVASILGILSVLFFLGLVFSGPISK